jgi:hypothetical protein
MQPYCLTRYSCIKNAGPRSGYALSADSQNTAACVDVFVAFFDQDPDFLGTSTVPPYVAAMAIGVENKAPERLDAANSERVKQLMGEGAPRLFEPRSNHQFESF